MGAALGAADEVVVLDVYVARETPDPAVTGRLVADAVPLPAERVVFVAGLDEAAAELAARARDGDLVLTLGAGSVTAVGPAGPGAARERTGEGPEATRRRRDTAERAALRSRQRFTRRQWRRRWLAWRYVVARGRWSSRWSPAASGSSTSRPCSP